ncbi:helix-turn-helix domain-containing protein [Clostridioides mangenotii]|uniref:helix-turn-helix domain-containing protein n=1 Tax=Metaclostridioides mangenotii TaxID=1540 RepID=UPI002149A5CC|nr:helix-turn-helix domain-containing protein [Clostridioides mangenotii]MCR1953337.1 helix-turn-helix domain-containing protein [Clostridioides mangenotii]
MNLLKDKREKNWFMVENELIDNLNLTIYEKMVYMVLVRHANEDSSCFPSITTIAKKTGCSRPTAIKALNGLERLEFIKKEIRTVKGRKENDSNLYYVMSVGGSKGDLPPSKPDLPPKEENVSKVVNEVNHVVKEIYYPSKGDLPQVVNQVDCNNTNINNTNLSNVSMYVGNIPVDSILKEYINLYEKYIGKVTVRIVEELQDISKSINTRLFEEALIICTDNNKLELRYLRGILKNWIADNITIYEQLKSLEIEKEKAKAKQREAKDKKYKPNNIQNSKKTKFHNFKETFQKYSPDELEEIIRKSQREKFK